MLACPRCMSRSGTHTAAMLLATVIGKIASFYESAWHSHFENGEGEGADGGEGEGADGGGGEGRGEEGREIGFTQSSGPAGSRGVSLGAYQLNREDGRWLELEILARELRKLQEVYTRFREVCAELSDYPEVSKAMIDYLNHKLDSTMEVVSHRKGDMLGGG